MIKGFACGVFDLFHPGHVLMLRDCKSHCDHLTVALNKAREFDSEINPGKRKPIFSLEERRLIISSIRYVDDVMEYESEEELTEIMKSGEFDIRFLGDDYRGKPITAAHAISNIKYIDRSHGYSTTLLLERIISGKK